METRFALTALAGASSAHSIAHRSFSTGCRRHATCERNILMAARKAAGKSPGNRARTARESGSGARTVLLLRQIADMTGEFTLSKLAQGGGLPPSSVHRMLQPLLNAGLVARSEGSSYRAGQEYYRLAAAVLRQIDSEINASAFLNPLWNKWQETAVFCMYRPAQRIGIVTEIIQSPHSLRHVIEPFEAIPLIRGSLGRAILAYLDLGLVKALRNDTPKGRITGAPAPALKDLLRELELVRRRGIAIYRNQDADLAGVAAPVFRSGNVIVGSIGITMPTHRYDRLNANALQKDVIAASRQLAETLGHPDGNSKR